MWWLWVLGGLFAWLGVGALVALAVGRLVRVPARHAPSPAAARRLRIPLPPFAVGLVGTAVALETLGYVVGLTGGRGQVARLLSMDAPLSVPRMYVAALFGAAALAAVAGAGTMPGRRTWWLAVGTVSGAVCAVKAGSTVHSIAVAELSAAVTLPGAVLVSAAVASAVVGGLWFLSRSDRRDRRRVLSALALYAFASVGLSALSSAATVAYGSTTAAALAATYLEETGEALAAVTMLVAVLAGVAPRVVLPAAWGLRRTADEHTLQVPETPPAAVRTPQV